MYLKRTIAIGSAVLFSLATAGARGATPSVADLQAHIASQDARIAQLESKQSTPAMSPDEIKAMVNEAVADADTRSSLLESGVSAGHNGQHFFLSNDAGTFLLEIKGNIDFRYIANFRDSDNHFGDAGETGFEFRHTYLDFSGHIADPRLMYHLRLEVRTDNDVVASRITVAYKFNDNFTLWFGEDIAPFLTEDIVDESEQLAVEKSLVAEFFGLGFVQGIGVKFNVGSMIKIQAMFDDGARSAENGSNIQTQFGFVADSDISEFLDHNFSESVLSVNGGFFSSESIFKEFAGDRTNFGFTIRVDFKVMGDWSQDGDFSSVSSDATALFLGAAIHYENGETGDSGFNNNLFTWTIDAKFKMKGLAIFGSFVGLHSDLDDAVGIPNFDLYGLVIQASYNINDTFEPYVRWESFFLGDFQDLGVTSQDNVNLITFGLNWYNHRHDAKATVDVVVCLDPIEGGITFFTRGNTGILTDAANADNQFVIRVKYSMRF